ncbi:MAG: TadE/TadG family type IV pilus assembly protein [Sphingomonadaceae bacterium]
MTVVEFGIVAPVFFVMLLGAFELGQAIYVRAVLHGAVQAAGRNATLESGAANIALIDAEVLTQVSRIAPGGTVQTMRKNYQTFNNVDVPEDFTDSNGNNSYDAGAECFWDMNGNSTWDADRAMSGLGGANDVVVYTSTLTYDRLVPLWKFMGWSQQAEVSASTVLRNQPFNAQAMRTGEQICP